MREDVGDVGGGCWMWVEEDVGEDVEEIECGWGQAISAATHVALFSGFLHP